MYKKIVLDNGLTVILADMPHMESVSVGIWITAGGRYETKRLSGVSHFLEHMLFKGTKKRTCKQIKESIEGTGGSLNGFTGEECTCYLAKVLSGNIDMAADILGDMTRNAMMNPDDFNREKGVILEELKMYMDMPGHYVQELLSELMWPGQQLGMPLIGTFDTVTKLKLADLVSYKDRYYAPQNVVVSAAGRIASLDFVKRFEGWPRRGAPQRDSFKNVSIRQAGPRINYHAKETEQTHLAMGFHGYGKFHPRRYDLAVLSIILGGNMSSRLFNEVREKRGLAYEIHSTSKYYYDTGAFIISAGIDNKKVGPAADVIIKELRRIKKCGISKDEFSRAMEFYRGQLLMMFEDTSGHMLWLGEKVLNGEDNFRLEQVLERISKVTPDSVRETASKVFTPKKVNVAVIGPKGGKKEASIEKT
ncbi:MAG: pitrilysin family protein, partial [Candidatus Omnitrophota bacterium]